MHIIKNIIIKLFFLNCHVTVKFFIITFTSGRKISIEDPILGDWVLEEAN